MIRRIAALVVIIGFVIFVVGRYLGSLPGYQYSGPIPPDYVYAIIGFFSALVGIVILAADFLRKMVVLPTPEKVTALIGWSLVVVGLIAITVGALEENPCSNCYFNVNGSFVIFWGGIVAALAGLTVVASAFLASQFRPTVHNRLVRWVLAAIVVALVVAILWTASGAYSAYVNDSNAANSGYSVLLGLRMGR